MRRTAELALDESRATALIEAKDIALLYELWCYFEVVGMLTKELGPPERASPVAASPWEVGIPQEFEVRWTARGSGRGGASANSCAAHQAEYRGITSGARCCAQAGEGEGVPRMRSLREPREECTAGERPLANCSFIRDPSPFVQ